MDVVDRATRVLTAAEARLRTWDTPLEAAVLAVTDRRLTEDIDTLAVELRADGVARLLANPHFVIDVGVEGSAFVLCHEAMHLLLRHLHTGRRDAAWQLACEVVINHWVSRHTGRSLPTSARTGRPVGVDPDAVHQQFAADVPFATFVATDEGCAAFLRRSDDPLVSPACGHTDPDSDDPDGPDAHPGDHDQADRRHADHLDELLQRQLRRAADGDEHAVRQLTGLYELTPDAPSWTRIDLHVLRSTAARLGDTRLWERHLAQVVAQHLEPEQQVGYDRKTGWWDAALLAELGLDVDPSFGMPLVPVVTANAHRRVAVYLDASGSIGDVLLDRIATTVGQVPDTTIHWATFDTEVHPFQPGQPMRGGGGTDFDCIVTAERERDEPLDAVVVLTDGEAEPVDPPDRHRWLWLITEDGDPWPRHRGMRTVVVPDLQVPAAS